MSHYDYTSINYIDLSDEWVFLSVVTVIGSVFLAFGLTFCALVRSVMTHKCPPTARRPGTLPSKATTDMKKTPSSTSSTDSLAFIIFVKSKILTRFTAEKKPLAVIWIEQAEASEKRTIHDTIHNRKHGMLVTISGKASEGRSSHTFFVAVPGLSSFDTSCFSALCRSVNMVHPASRAIAGRETDECDASRREKEEEAERDPVDLDRMSPLPNGAFFSEDPQECTTRIKKLMARFEEAAGIRLTTTMDRELLLLHACWRRGEGAPANPN